MKTTKLLVTAILFIFSLASKAQNKESYSSKGWELSISAGPAYVDYPKELSPSEYSTGTSLLSEIKYSHNKHFATGIGFMVLNSTDGLTNKTLKIANNFQAGLKQSEWSLGLNGYYSPLNTRKNELFVSLGAGFCMSDFLYAGRPSGNQSYSIIMNQRNQGLLYQYSAGYKFKINKHFSLGARYLKTHHQEGTDHLLLSLGYKI